MGITLLLLTVPGKTFAFTLLTRIKARLLESRRVEQCGFTPGRSMVDRILTLNTLNQTRRELGHPFWIAYVDMKSAFDLVDTESLWLLLCRLGEGIDAAVYSRLTSVFTQPGGRPTTLTTYHRHGNTPLVHLRDSL